MEDLLLLLAPWEFPVLLSAVIVAGIELIRPHFAKLANSPKDERAAGTVPRGTSTSALSNI